MTLSRIECTRRGWAQLTPATATIRVQDSAGFMHVRQADLLGCIDALSSVLCEDGRTVTIAIQFSSKANVKARAKKIRDSRGWPFLVDAGWHTLSWGWDDDANLTEIVVLDRLPG